MSKIAIDIAFIPPKEIFDLCIELCQKFPDDSNRLPLNHKDNFPHISLFMGLVDEDEIKNLSEKVQKLIKDLPPIQTILTKIVNIPQPDGRKTYFFDVNKTPELYKLHRRLVEELKEEYTGSVDPSMYYKTEGEEIEKEALHWTENYTDGSSLENFWPHITLKACADPKCNDLPKDIILDRLDICHLGNYCTCRKILAEFKL